MINKKKGHPIKVAFTFFLFYEITYPYPLPFLFSDFLDF